IQGGAYSFLEKPFDPRRLLTILSNAVRMRQLENRANELQEKLTRLTDLSQVLIGDSPEINTVRSLVFDYADVPANVLIRGRTGTGKELVARALHDLGAGPEKPFIAVNCAAIPPDGFEQHVIGGGDGPSLLEKAHGGTLFLDELTSMPLETQSKFLRAIETETQDIRIISAASQDLEASVANGSLREDLLFRLNTLVIEIPDLRERGDDILLLYRHYLGRIAALYDLPLPETTNDDYAALIAHDWPGNVRELQNVVERRVLAERRGVGSVRQALIGIPTTQTMPDTLREAVAVFEKEIISQAIVIAQGRMDDAAAHLGIGRRTLNEKVSKLAIDKSKLLNS
ncbi:MAG: sigma-54 dependent transcriptional regulator, partial [Boseongicola sp.]|nr:sigma-54 dependent transcriptional regulator [Boseongicola sp.]